MKETFTKTEVIKYMEFASDLLLLASEYGMDSKEVELLLDESPKWMYDLYREWSVFANDKYTVEGLRRVCKQLPDKLV